MRDGVRDSVGELPPVLTVEETCRVLGLGKSAGYRAVAAGQIPAVRLGRRLFVPTARLLEMLGLEANADAVISRVNAQPVWLRRVRRIDGSRQAG